jgi:hypothetical protein
MARLKGAKDAYPLLQPSHLQPPQGCILRLFDSLELGLEEIELKLLVGMMMFKLAVHADVAVEAPVPVFAGCLLQGCVGHGRALKKLQEPMGHGQDHVVIIAIVVGGRIDLLDPGDLVWSMLLWESHDAAVGELFDPVSGLPHSILNGDGEAGAASVAVEDIPIRAFFGREGSVVVDQTRSEKLEFLPLGVPLPGPLFLIRSVLAFALLESADEAACDVGDCVKVVSDLNGGLGSARGIDGS